MTEPRDIQELMLNTDVRLEELAERPALGEMVQTFYALFRVPLRVFSEHSGLLAEAGAAPAIYTYLSEFPEGRRAVDAVIAEVLAKRPPPGESLQVACFTRAVYHITSVAVDGRSIGRLVLGPFLPSDVSKLEAAIVALDSRIVVAEAKQALAQLPRAKPETVARIAAHLQSSLDLILFSGHKALLTSAMHLASVRESFRELKEKNEELRAAYESLQQLDRLKNNFLATVSHELRTPLTSIIGYSEMLDQGIAGPLTEEQGSFVSTIHEKGQQLLEMISGLLDMSKLDSGTLALRKEDVDIPALVRDVLHTFAPMANRAGVKITARVDSGLPALKGDGMRLRQVLTNLVDNALKFTPAGGDISVEASLDRFAPDPSEGAGLIVLAGAQPAIKLVVSDSGIGIPDSEKERVFDPFYQVDGGTTRQVGGTGLGLSIVRRLVEGHQGTVRVVDHPPQGAAFVVLLPLAHVTLG